MSILSPVLKHSGECGYCWENFSVFDTDVVFHDGKNGIHHPFHYKCIEKVADFQKTSSLECPLCEAHVLVKSYDPAAKNLTKIFYKHALFGMTVIFLGGIIGSIIVPSRFSYDEGNVDVTFTFNLARIVRYSLIGAVGAGTIALFTPRNRL